MRNQRVPIHPTGALGRSVHVNFITRASLDEDGGITAYTRGSSVAKKYSRLGTSRAGEQVTEALFERLYINGGTWTSTATLNVLRNSATTFLAWMAANHGIDDLASPALTLAMIRDGVTSTATVGTVQRALRSFLAEAILPLREDGEVFREALDSWTFSGTGSRVVGYAPETADAIEQIARKWVGEWYLRHRNAVRDALGDLPTNWMFVSAIDLIDVALEACPRQFAVHANDLAASMVLLSLVDDKGPNLATIQSTTSDSVERVNDDSAFVTGTKARNRQIVKTPSPAGGLFSYGGLLEFVTAAGRVDRLFRQHDDDFDRLLFVPTGAPTVVHTTQVNRWWDRSSELWTNTNLVRPKTLSFQRLRKAAVVRGQHRGLGVIAQKPATARLYLADALPDVILVPGLLATQRNMANHWRVNAKEGLIPQVGTGPIEAIARLGCATEVMDVGVAACASNGQLPTDESKPCGLGPVACFVCPSGFRTPEVIPGLLATVEFTDNIRKYEPNEWLSGEAPILNRLARKALDQFPAEFLGGVSPEEVANKRALIACIYSESTSRA